MAKLFRVAFENVLDDGNVQVKTVSGVDVGEAIQALTENLGITPSIKSVEVVASIDIEAAAQTLQKQVDALQPVGQTPLVP